MDKSKRSRGDADDPADGLIGKAKVLQDAKEVFRAAPGKTSKLVDVLTKCIYLMLRGEKLTNAEATELFLHITFLFQHKSKDNTLRRLIYIAIKALSQQADQLFAVTASLTADVNNSGHDPAVRASALRALCQIADASTLESIESCLRQSIVDKHPVVASAALASLIHVAEQKSKLVERCSSEIQEALKSDSPMVQYHALALCYTTCKDDPQARTKFLSACVHQRPASPFAQCLLMRLLASHIDDSSVNADTVKLYARYISDCLSHGSEMVAYEAAGRIVAITREHAPLIKPKAPGQNHHSSIKPAPLVAKQDVRYADALAHLRNLLSAPRASLRFSAVRLLNEHGAGSLDTRCWTIQRIGNLCKLHLLTKPYKPGDEIIGMLEFIKSSVVCAKYTCTIQCERAQMFEVRQEFSLGYKRGDFAIAIPELSVASQRAAHLDIGGDASGNEDDSTLHCVLSFLFYITDRNYPRALFEDKAGTIELAPSEIETKQFSCDFPILINTLQSFRVDTCVAGANV